MERGGLAFLYKGWYSDLRALHEETLRRFVLVNRTHFADTNPSCVRVTKSSHGSFFHETPFICLVYPKAGLQNLPISGIFPPLPPGPVLHQKVRNFFSLGGQGHSNFFFSEGEHLRFLL